MARFLSSTLVALIALSFATGSAAQGVQTGSIRGVVKDASGQIVPHGRRGQTVGGDRRDRVRLDFEIATLRRDLETDQRGGGRELLDAATAV